MTKKEYLDLIKEIGTAVRAAGIVYEIGRAHV